MDLILNEILVVFSYVNEDISPPRQTKLYFSEMQYTSSIARIIITPRNIYYLYSSVNQQRIRELTWKMGANNFYFELLPFAFHKSSNANPRNLCIIPSIATYVTLGESYKNNKNY